jgi:hypothetical protein
MSARKRTRPVSEEFTNSRSIQQTHDFIEEEPATSIDSWPTITRSRTNTTTTTTTYSADRSSMDPLDLPARVLLRHVYFLNVEKTGYVLVGFYPARYYRVLTEFGGPRITSITLTEQHITTLMEHLPKLCAERYACNDGVFGLLYSRGTHSVARKYQDTR